MNYLNVIVKKKKEKDYVKFCKRTAKKTPVYVGIIT